MTQLLDYALNKLFYDLHTTPPLAEEYRRDRPAVIARYPLAPAVAAGLRQDDVAALAPLTNGFLMRYYFIAAGLPERAFLDQLHAMKTAATTAGQREAAHG